MAENVRSRRPSMSLHLRNVSAASVGSDSSDSSPDRERDDDGDYFTSHENDSQSTICPLTTAKDYDMDVDWEQIHRVTPISKLPPELLIAIFSRLTSTTDLRNCMLVSYHWALYSVSLLWHRPLCNKWANLENVARTLADHRPAFPYHEMVKRLNLSVIASKVNDGTAQAFMKCKSIERLTLTSCSKLTDFGVKGLIEGNRRLQALDVTDLDALTDQTLLAVAVNCAKLQGLNITNCRNITDESLLAIAHSCRQLKRLKLNSVDRVTDQSVMAVAQHCRSVLEIDLDGCQLITSESVTALLANLPSLRELRLMRCIEVTDSAFTNLPARAQFDALRILDLSACEQVRDDAIARIIPAAPRLRNLVLSKCRHITDQAVNSICKLTKNLHYIHLGHCTNLTDAAVINLVKHCNRIRYIDLACCSRLTDASVRHLAQLPKLRRIGLVKCTNLTDVSIIALAHGPLAFSSGGKIAVPQQYVSLERVHLSYCVNLTLKGITALLYHCPKLTHLSLTGVQAFFIRDDLTRFCREAPPEFTHPQRDVFCVFSGDGVIKLREYLARLAMEEVEREQQNAVEESLMDPDDSPGAETMSEDGTIDGNDQGVDLAYGPGRNGYVSVTSSRTRQRPRSLQNLSSHPIDVPIFSSDAVHRTGSWTPHMAFSPERFASPHLNLMSSNDMHPMEAGRPHSIRGMVPMAEMESEPMSDEEARAHQSARRHTMTETDLWSAASSSRSGQLASMYPPYPGSQDTDESRRLGASGLHQPSTSRRGQRALPTPRLASRPMPSPQHLFSPLSHQVSSFDVNHEAIMSTIPGAPGHPSNTSTLQHRTSRSRPAQLAATAHAASFSSSSLPSMSPADRVARQIRNDLSSEVARHRDRAHREALFQVLAEAESRTILRPDLPPVPATFDAPRDMPLLPPGLMERVVASPDTPHSSPHQSEPDLSLDDNQDVNMTQ